METITRKKFEAYLDVQMGGQTNMFDVRRVVELAGGVLTKEDCLVIMKNYNQLKTNFNYN